MRFTAALFLTLFLFASAASAGQIEDGIAAYNAKNYDEAVKLLQPLAEQGNALAQYQLGYMHLYGQGVPKDYAEAWFWLTIAANATGPDAKAAQTAAAGRAMILKQLTPAQAEAVKKRVEDWKPVVAPGATPAPADTATP
jgi:TPR repeat protein